jgi:P-type Cu2+ transporter
VISAPTPTLPRVAPNPLSRNAGEGWGGGVATLATLCIHCDLPAPPNRRFCCPGCAAAYETIQTLGLGRYYTQRILDPALRAPRPDTTEQRDLSRYITTNTDNTHELTLAVDGLQCGACVWLIESVLAREPTVLQGRVNMTTRRLKLTWRGAAEQSASLLAKIENLGYRLVPFDATALAAARDDKGRALLRALAVAGFAAGNVMLMSIGIWAGEAGGLLHDMGPATRDLLHWVSALIAMPAIAYAGRPFFTSAATALRHGRTNMDVPISLGVILVTGMSLAQTMQGGAHTYFDSAITLLFFLLIGRVLDHRARGQARATAEQLLTLRASDVAVLQADGSTQRRSQQSVTPGDRVLVGLGERIGVDGIIERGSSSLDASLVTGESLPVAATPGTPVFAGTLNLGEPLTVRATATAGATLLAECVRLIEAAEARRSRFVVLADRVARRYAPAVHLAALLTFLGWYFIIGVPAEQALLIACAVLIITCPCALALAVPVVQVIATGTLFRAGVLLKSATALERLATVDTIVFDKTGTLTEPTLALQRGADFDEAALRVAASLAVSSRHPLARALVAVAGPVTARDGVVEYPGQGLCAGDVRLGNQDFCGVGVGEQSSNGLPLPLWAWAVKRTKVRGRGYEKVRARGYEQVKGRDRENVGGTTGPQLWLTRSDHPPVRFDFRETLRDDAATTIQHLRSLGIDIHLLSGDHAAAVAPIAATLGIANWQSDCSPPQKVAAIESLLSSGRKVLMVGDGLNDSPSLAAATVSASPATAADVSQTVADVVFQGRRLVPIATIIETARRSHRVMRQNLALSIGYNVLLVPLAVAGFVTPWLAAAAMSSSSLLVMANSFRLRGRSS